MLLLLALLRMTLAAAAAVAAATVRSKPGRWFLAWNLKASCPFLDFGGGPAEALKGPLLREREGV